VPLLAFGGTSLLAFMEALRFTTSAWVGHASIAAIVQANPAKADRKIVGCIAFSSLIRLSRFANTAILHLFRCLSKALCRDIFAQSMPPLMRTAGFRFSPIVTRKCPQSARYSSETGKRRFASDCVVGPGAVTQTSIVNGLRVKSALTAH